MKPILSELKEIIETQILPDGDHIDIPVSLCLEGLHERIRKGDNIINLIETGKGGEEN